MAIWSRPATGPKGRTRACGSFALAAASGSKWPVIFMAASDDEATHNEAMDAGCIAYLRKPFAQHVLLNAISEAVA